MEHSETTLSGLPDNAYKELKPGEEYRPIMDPNQEYPEVTTWSVAWGLVMSVLFSAAAAYSGLKIGQVFEAAIPIAILAVGLSTAFKKKNALGENVMIQSIGAASGVIVAGAIFTIPALYILNLPVNFFKVFAAAALGGFLGILFLIPFRKFFVKDMHGKFPFPEATATTEILVAGEKGGAQAGVLITAGIVGGLYDFVFSAFGLWPEVVTSRMTSFGHEVADKLKLVLRLNVSAVVFGLGYIVGLRYSAIIAAGSLLSWLVFVPLIQEVGQGLMSPLGATATKLISAMSAEEIFRAYVRPIGIGGIAMAGVIGIIRSSKIIIGAFKLAASEILRKKGTGEKQVRWQTDLSMKTVASLILLTAVLIFVFFYAGVVNQIGLALIGLAIVLIISFLFTTVAANAIAIVGTNPISGMTLMTLILSSFVLVRVGLTGDAGIVSALLIGGVVCTSLSMAGGFITDLKVGYWLGSTPRKQETWKFLGTLASAATVGGVIYILNQTFTFTGPNAMAAPQANAMAAVIKPLMSDTATPWVLYMVGALISLILVMVQLPPLAFALGMYIPQELNVPLVFGGLIAWYVSTRTKNEKLNNARLSRGTLIASGFIAGGSILGVFNALIRFFGQDWSTGLASWTETPAAEFVGLLMFFILMAYTLWDTMRAKEEN